jgi:hypothetical protein
MKIVKGKFFWKKEWYSFCSTHQTYNPKCNRCNTGQYVNVWGNYINGIFFKISPKLWKIYANRWKFKWWIKNMLSK